MDASRMKGASIGTRQHDNKRNTGQAEQGAEQVGVGQTDEIGNEAHNHHHGGAGRKRNHHEDAVGRRRAGGAVLLNQCQHDRCGREQGKAGQDQGGES